MLIVERSALVTYTPAQMFALVDAIDRYPELLPWCGKTEVHAREDGSVLASMHIDYMKIRQQFTTRNVNSPDTGILMQLVDGPFRHLEGQWRFVPLGDVGCKIEFRLSYEFSSRLLEKIIGPVFGHISGTLVDAFIKEADRVYGDD